MWVALGVEVSAVHTVSIPPHVCVNGSMTWQRATCLTWCDLQDHPLARTNTAQSQPGREKPFYALRQACGHHFSTCFQTLVRKRLHALTQRRHDVKARPSNWRQSGHFPLLHVWKRVEHTTLVGIWTLFLTPVGSSQLIKSLHKHAKENHFSSLIKQKCLWLDLCPKDTNTL